MDVSFSERLRNIVVLTDALSLSTGDPTQARAEARALEEDLYKRAESKHDYEALCEGLILVNSTTSASKPRHGGIEGDEILNFEGPTIGEYVYSTFHKDGQMSTIFKAKAKNESARHAIVALKLTTPSMMEPPHNSEREARILIAARSEYVVSLIESFWEPGGRFVLVFPFLPQDLENLLRSGTLTKVHSSKVVQSLFSALCHLHSLGIIHRDVKPSNILLTSMEGPVYLADFGIAWSPNDLESEPATSKITDVGTTSYRPLELLFGCRSYDESLDIWAAGCVVAEMVKPDHSSLFDAGPLGSELGLIKSVFSTLGTPTDETWPSAKQYPDWGKMRFQEFPSKKWREILPGASSTAQDFLGRTVCYESTQRMTAAEALQHPFAQELDHGLK